LHRQTPRSLRVCGSFCEKIVPLFSAVISL
jgi:hypothetical protein